MTEVAATQPEKPRLSSLRPTIARDPDGTKVQPLIISAPFGNYIQPVGATATLGTFTALRRPGRFWRVIRTVRYYPRIGAWVNQIGLRNPGIDWLTQQVRAGRIDPPDKIISIHGFDDAEWRTLLEQTQEIKPLAIELNMSCPNVGHINWPPDLFERAGATGLPIIVKLPPVNFHAMTRQALDAGLRNFHCCNTIPVPRGGVSGKPLKPVAIQCIGEVRSIARALNIEPEIRIIGGGGITTPDDIDDYAAAGAHRVAIGTKAMNPLLLLTHQPLQSLIHHAEKRLICDEPRTN
jgi:dihydroorotate dehydrogenase